MTNDERQMLLQSEKLNGQVYLFVSDWANYQINLGMTDEKKVALVKKILDDVRSVAYAAAVILISDPAILAYTLPTWNEKVDGGIKRHVEYAVDDTTVKSIVDSTLDNKAAWLV